MNDLNSILLDGIVVKRRNKNNFTIEVKTDGIGQAEVFNVNIIKTINIDIKIDMKIRVVGKLTKNKIHANYIGIKTNK